LQGESRGRNSRARKAKNNEPRAPENQVFALLNGHFTLTPLNIDAYLPCDETANSIASLAVAYPPVSKLVRLRLKSSHAPGKSRPETSCATSARRYSTISTRARLLYYDHV
jgi:hypothetical protein